LFLTIGGVRYVLAGGDPAEVERAKTAFRSAATGYALAILAPVVVTVLRSLVGG
jgi:Type IV secretion system pilin